MQVGDLVRCDTNVGLIIRQIGDPWAIDCDQYWIVKWLNGTTETLNGLLLEVINESRLSGETQQVWKSRYPCEPREGSAQYATSACAWHP